MDRLIELESEICLVNIARSRAELSVTKTTTASSPTIAMITKSSMRVNACFPVVFDRDERVMEVTIALFGWDSIVLLG